MPIVGASGNPASLKNVLVPEIHSLSTPASSPARSRRGRNNAPSIHRLGLFAFQLDLDDLGHVYVEIGLQLADHPEPLDGGRFLLSRGQL